MTRSDDIELLAGEYVLGTLEAAERSVVEERRRVDRALDDAIVDWETRLSPLTEHYAEVAPPPHVLARIQAALARRGERLGDRHGDPRARVTRLERGLARWRAAAGVGYLLAACLAGVVAFQSLGQVQDDRRFVAVFQSNDEQPAFLLTINLKTRELLVRPVTAVPQQGKTYQLWIASRELGGKPKSLGLLDTPVRPTRKQLLQYDAELLEKATFGISLEPEGGSPTGVPTGPALHGKLIPTAL